MAQIRILRPDELQGLAELFPGDPTPEAPSVVLAADDPTCGLVGWGALCMLLHGNPMPPGRKFFHLSVRPDARGHGIGTALAGELLRLAVESGTQSLAASVKAEDARALAFAGRLGFRPDYEMLEAVLDLAEFQLEEWLPALEAPAASGIRFTSMAVEPDPEGALREVWELDGRLSADVPEWSGEVVPFPQYRQNIVDATGYHPAGLLLARDGDRVVGMCGTTAEPDGTGYTWFMGVDRACRGRGIALALKLLTIGWAQETGLSRLLTHNNSASAGIVGLNRKLGYRIAGRTQYLVR